MPSTRRRVLRGAAAAIGVAGLSALAGCSSSCPDSDRPTPTATVSIRDDPVGPFAAVPGGRWNGPHGDAGNTGYASGSLPSDAPVVRWRTDLAVPQTDSGGLSASSPTIGTEAVYVADEDRVHAVSLRTGETRWHSDVVSPTTWDTLSAHDANTVSPVVGADGEVLVGTTDALVALDPADGSVRWRVGDLSQVSRPVVLEGTVYALGTENLVAVAPDGTEDWRRSATRQSDPVPPAAGSGRIVYPGDGRVVAVNAEDGSRAWSRDRYVESHLVVADETCFVGNHQGLHAIDCKNGTQRWTFYRGDYRALRSPVVTPATIYAVEQPGEAGAASFALDRTDGEPSPRWCSYIGDGAVTGATDELVLAVLELGQGPDAAHSVVAFTADLGDAPWAIAGGFRPRDWVTRPALADDAVVVTTRGGTTVAFGARGDQ
jgi:outer membrane protein assembly factor BamB